MNIQPIEKRELRPDGILSVHSIFHTIQGEGPFCGMPSVFVRLAGCNLQCPACDTDYTTGRETMGPATIVETVSERIGDHPTRLVVITGGEPFRQNIRELVFRLLDEGYFVQIETNGTLEPTELPYNTNPELQYGVYVVCSPKTGKLHPRIYDVACALKYVVQAGNVNFVDGLPLQALEHTATPYPARPPEHWSGRVYVQPMDAKDPEANRLNYEAAKRCCLEYGHTLQIQVHKIIGVE